MLVNRPSDQSIAQLIGSAERFIGQQKFELARNQLEVARQLDPRNSYIGAIIDRLAELETIPTRHAAVSFTPTINPQSATGMRESEPWVNPLQIQAQVRHLTGIAEKHLDEGSVENAFDTLMKAYLLDPVSPYVLSCEKTLLPAWENVHPSNPSLAVEGESMNSRRSVPGQFTAEGAPPPPAELDAGQQQRIEALKTRKELERQERERAVWREASRPSIVLNRPGAAKPRPEDPGNEQSGGLFTRLKLGKFLEP
jgi:hypothetical protein